MVSVSYLSRSYLAALPTWLRTMATGVGRASPSARFCVGLPRWGKRFCRGRGAWNDPVIRRARRKASVIACSRDPPPLECARDRVII